MKSMDCTDIRVLLSGLIDDEVDAETRHQADRHIARCQACTAMIGQAEALDGLVVADTDVWNDEVNGDGVSDAFIGTVLSRTVYARQRPHFRERFTTWTGWIAVAAVMILAMTVWIMDRQLRQTRNADQQAVAITATAYRPGPELRSSTRPLPTYTGGVQAAAFLPDSRLAHHDALALDTAAVVLDMLIATPPEDAIEIERMRRIVEYDQLLERLADARMRLPDADHPAVHAAEAILTRLLLVSPDATELRHLRETTQRLDLHQSLGAMSNRNWIQPPA